MTEMPSMCLIGHILDMVLKIKMPTSFPLIEPWLSILGPVLQYYAKLNLNASLHKLLGSQEPVVNRYTYCMLAVKTYDECSCTRTGEIRGSDVGRK